MREPEWELWIAAGGQPNDKIDSGQLDLRQNGGILRMVVGDFDP